MEVKKSIKQIFNNYFKEIGFTIGANSWYRFNGEFYQIIEIERFKSSSDFTFTFGYSFNKKENQIENILKNFDWHLQNRMEPFVKDKEKRFELIELTKHKDLPIEAIRKNCDKIFQFLKSEVVTIFDQYNSYERIIDLIESEKYKEYFLVTNYTTDDLLKFIRKISKSRPHDKADSAG